jgi:phosphoenolpyruvate synthase/pyruvate phosphate dikinase
LDFSRDDIGSFLPEYLDKKILPVDPFQVIDFEGVGQLMKIAVEKGRSTRKDLKIGICGEHGGEPKSVEFCHSLGFSYVSCSPFRVPKEISTSGRCTGSHQAKESVKELMNCRRQKHEYFGKKE